MRFVVTGSGRCGTKYTAQVLTAAGVKCGHEKVFDFDTGDQPDWRGYRADSSWMALPWLDRIDEPVVLMVRHPMEVVRSLVQVGFYSHHDADNPCHAVARREFPDLYEYSNPADRALAMWLHWNSSALRYAELVFRIETFGVHSLARLLRWSGHPPDRAADAISAVTNRNTHDRLKRRFLIDHRPGWDQHDRELADRARWLATAFGYQI